LVVLGSCSADKAAGPPVDVESSATTCRAVTTSFHSGKSTFRVRNTGDAPTELYVKDRAGKIVGEVENIGPGTSRNLTVALKAGAYTLVCKPGQTGSGIDEQITVS